MKIAIFGGSFDPPHIGHIEIVKKALKELDIDLLIIVPTFINPFKKQFTAPPCLRLKWLKKIFLTNLKVLVSDFEIRQQRPTYAIETVSYIKRRFAPKKIYYIIGSDNLSTLPLWKSYHRLRKEVEFIVATRKGYQIDKKFKILKLNIPISSTTLRQNPIQRFLPKIIAHQIRRFYLE